MRLNVARTLSGSAANGPGERFVVWVQGCPLGCQGCWNPDTWSFAGRDVRDLADLAAEILATPGIEGVTFTGGEPFAQASALAQLGRSARMAGLSVFVFSGYDLAELTSGPALELLAETDVLVSGRYIERLRALDLPWRGSSNQEVHFLTSRYTPRDMESAPSVEIRIGRDAGISITGFPPEGLLLPRKRRRLSGPRGA